MKNMFYIGAFTFFSFIVCFLGSSFVFAEEVPEEMQENVYDYLEDIRDGVNDINTTLSEQKKQDEEYYQDSLSDSAEMKEIMEEENVVDIDRNVNMESNDNQEGDNDINDYTLSGESEDSTEGPEEATTEVVEGDNSENNDISDNTISKADIMEIHGDLQKIMISMWALAGLYLGTKLISRMFGNG